MLLRALKEDVLDCIFADPPFNLGKHYGKGEVNDPLGTDEYLQWSRAWLKECIRVLKPGAALFIYIIPRWGYHFASYLESQGMLFRHWIAVSMKGTFPRGQKLYPAHYGLLYFTKGPPKTFNRLRLPIPTCRHCGKDIKDYGGHGKYLNPLGLNLTDFWDDTAPARHKKFKSRWHINELKPMIPARCIEIATNPGEIICDPFGGGGSTYQAAQCIQRYWLGTEITDCTPIVQRMQEHFPDQVGKLLRKSCCLSLGNLCRASTKSKIIMARWCALGAWGCNRSSMSFGSFSRGLSYSSVRRLMRTVAQPSGGSSMKNFAGSADGGVPDPVVSIGASVRSLMA